MDKVFPENYPNDLLERITEDGAGNNTIDNVYRVANYGENNRDAFLSTFLTNIKDSLNTNNRDVCKAQEQTYDIGTYSTSLYAKAKRAKNILLLLERKYNGPILLKGTVLPEYGMSMYTRDSKTRDVNKKSSHIDWWVYKDEDPSEHFEIVEVNK